MQVSGDALSSLQSDGSHFGVAGRPMFATESRSGHHLGEPGSWPYNHEITCQVAARFHMFPKNELRMIVENFIQLLSNVSCS